MKTWEINEVENEGYMHACLPAYPCANTPLAPFLPLFLSDFVHYASMSVCVCVCVRVRVCVWVVGGVIGAPHALPYSAPSPSISPPSPCLPPLLSGFVPYAYIRVCVCVSVRVRVCVCVCVC